MRTYILLLVGLSACNTDPKSNLESMFWGTTDAEVKPVDDSCALYTKNKDGFTLKLASITPPELVGGTEAEKVSFKNVKNPYGAYWSCSVLAFNNIASWCECPRHTNKAFEDQVSKVNTRIIWLPASKE